MANISTDKLSKILVQKVDVAINKIIRTDGNISNKQLQTIEKLSRLVQIRADIKPPSRKKWPILLLFTGTLLIISILLFGRVPTTEIELDLRVSELGFTMPVQQTLMGVTRLDSIGVSNLGNIQIPRSVKRPALIFNSSNPLGYAINLIPLKKEGLQGMVSLAPLILPTNTQVQLSQTEIARQFRMYLTGFKQEVLIDVFGSIQVGMTDASTEQYNFQSPRSISLQPSSNVVQINLSLHDKQREVFFSQLAVNNLTLYRIDEFTNSHATVVKRNSTILSGNIYYESLNGLKRLLRPGENLSFKQIKGMIRTINFKDEQIKIKFHGEVKGMASGWGNNRNNLMPSLLEWLRAHHGLSLLWGTTLYLFGLIIIGLRWWGVHV